MVTFLEGGGEIIIFSGQLAKNLLTKSEVWSKNQLNNEKKKNHFFFFFLLSGGKSYICIYKSYKKHYCVLISPGFGSQFGCWKLK